MQLTTFSDYALRILIYLAVMPDDTTTAQEVAERYGISFHHIAKAAQWLAREGYIDSTRGRGGGIKLALPPQEISLGEILRKSEEATALVECMRSSGGQCKIIRGCGLIGILNDAEETFFQSLDDKTLLDAVGGRQRVARALRLV